METNTVVYPNFTCTDKTVIPNQVFVTAGNVEKIKPEFKKMVENDNKRSTTKVFFANQNTIENNLTQNSYIFQRQKPPQKWLVNHEKEKKVFQKDVKTKSEVKLNSHELKMMVGKFSSENNVSKRKTRKEIFWQIVSTKSLKLLKHRIRNQQHQNLKRQTNLKTIC